MLIYTHPDPPSYSGLFETILIDFDGVVVDTEPVFARHDCAHLNEYLELAGYAPELTPERVRAMAGNPAERKFEIVAAERGFDPAPYMASFSASRNHARQNLFCVNPPPFGRGIAGFLARHGMRCGLITNKTMEKLAHDLSCVAIGRDFRVLVPCDPPARLKPAPDVLYKAMGLLDADPRTTLYIGDNVSDMEAAKAAGICAAGFCITGISKEPVSVSRLQGAGASFVFDDFSDILPFVCTDSGAP